MKTLTPENMPKRTKYLTRIQNALISAQELGDEKMHIVNKMQELIETRTRQLDNDYKNLDCSEDLQQEPPSKLPRASSPTNSNLGGTRNEYGVYGTTIAHQRESTPTSQNSEKNSSNGERNINGKRTRRPRNDADNDSSENSSSNKNNGSSSGANGLLNISGGAVAGSSKNNKIGQTSGNSTSKQKKKRKSRQGREREESPPPDQIDPDEPTYCLCDQVNEEYLLCLPLFFFLPLLLFTDFLR